MIRPATMRGPAPPRFPTGTGTGTASGSAESGAASETRSENGDAPALGTGGGAPGVATRMSGGAPGNAVRTRTGNGSGEAAGAVSGHDVSGSARRSCVVVEEVATWRSPLRLVMRLLMTGLLGSWVLMALTVQRKRAGIVTGNDVGATGVSGSGAGTVTETGIASTSGGSGVVNGAGMRPEVEVGVARTTGWRVWATTAETCTWSLREATGTLLQRTGI
uniref:Small nuclear ribonucleoprotein U1 subunit 70 n=1 Tax=Equus asinus TaxID=9793 RepID=A0A9L0IE46_EQUAS